MKQSILAGLALTSHRFQTALVEEGVFMHDGRVVA